MSGGEVDYRRLTNLGTARYRVEESAGRIRKRRELIRSSGSEQDLQYR